MPESVPLSFSEPTDINIVRLRVFESVGSDGPFVEIDSTTEVGTYPTYITSYTTQVANSKTDWFAIKWEDEAGALSPLSLPVKGGEATLVGVVTDRVLQRDWSLDRGVVAQEAEGAIQTYFGDDADPYTIDVDSISYRILNGLVYLALARSYIFADAVDGGGFTIGMVTLKNGSSKNVQLLIDLANAQLGTSTSVVLQMTRIRRGGCRVWINEP